MQNYLFVPPLNLLRRRRRPRDPNPNPLLSSPLPPLHGDLLLLHQIGHRPAFLLISAAAAAFVLFLLLTSLAPAPPCSCAHSSTTTTVTTTTTTSLNPTPSPHLDDLSWLRSQLALNSLGDPPPPRPRGAPSARASTPAPAPSNSTIFGGISHYEDVDAANHTALPCPGELLVEEHHSNYGEPWAGGRDVFEFLATKSNLASADYVLEIGCGTLRVGQHFIRYLNPGRFHCLERDELSLMAALRYELPSQGLLYKRPLIVKGEDMDFSRFGSGISYDLIYASAVFLHMPDKLVWVGLERLAGKL
uniref:Methyltransferase type 12 domain-containing protein n=1 Tax=Ananas comosus var. bracteatus TaxID=296719 RepID=A0A6V7PRC2_ANACO|nr:unnamed protein product [Ananas comosus var. bracteatus]